MFSGQTANNKDIANIQNNMLSGSKTSSRNGSVENVNVINTENEVILIFITSMPSTKHNVHLLQLRKAFNKQTEEIKNLRNQLDHSDKRVRELEAEVSRLQLKLRAWV